MNLVKKIGVCDDGEFWKNENGDTILVTWEMFENGTVTEP